MPLRQRSTDAALTLRSHACETAPRLWRGPVAYNQIYQNRQASCHNPGTPKKKEIRVRRYGLWKSASLKTLFKALKVCELWKPLWKSASLKTLFKALKVCELESPFESLWALKPLWKSVSFEAPLKAYELWKPLFKALKVCELLSPFESLWALKPLWKPVSFESPFESLWALKAPF